METAVSAEPGMTAAGGRSNGVRPSLSSATSYPCGRTVRRRRSPRDFMAPTHAANISWSPEQALAPPACPIAHHALGLTCSYCRSRRNEFRFSPSVVTSRPGGPVCVLTDLLSRLEEDYSTLQRMSSRSDPDFLVDRRQGQRCVPAGTCGPRRRLSPPRTSSKTTTVPEVSASAASLPA